MNTPSDLLNPLYFETHFECSAMCEDWPVNFAIITAYATTGESWPEKINQAADQQMEADLVKRNIWMKRLTGFSPITGHRELGWAVDLDSSIACDIGLQYSQDAIYYVSGDTLSVSYCDSRRSLREVGGFRVRLHLASKTQLNSNISSD